MPKPVKPRFENLEAANAAGLSPENYETLKNRLNNYLFNSLGIQLDENQKAPSSNLIIPRLQYLGKDPADGVERFQNINDTPFTPGSKEFFDQVMMGNIYAYPTGSPNPVQLQVDVEAVQGGGFRTKLTSSDPFPPENMPSRRATAPSFLTRLWARIPFLGRSAKRRVDEYNAIQNEHNRAVAKLRDNAEGRAKISQQEKDELVKLKDMAAKKSELKDIEMSKDLTEVGRNRLVGVFKPTPDKRPDLMKLDKKHPLGTNYNYYTESHFRDLTILTNDENTVRNQLEQIDNQIEQDRIQAGKKKGLSEEQLKKMHPKTYSEGKPYKFQAFDQNSIQIGEEGKKKALNDNQFAAVALAAYWQPKYLKPAAQAYKKYDPTLEAAFEGAGYSKEQAEEMACVSQRSMGVTDSFIDKIRDNGGDYIKFFDPARKEAAAAFEAYKNNDKEPLAKLLAGGVNRFAYDFKSISGSKLAAQTQGTVRMGRELLGLMDQDSQLKTLALKHGMKQENLQALTGMAKIQDMEQKGLEASYAIAKARVEGNPLSTQQKAQYAKQMLLPKIAMLDMASQCKQYEANPNCLFSKITSGNAIQKPPTKPGPKGQEVPLDGKDRVPPEKGKFYSDTQTEAADAIRMMSHPLVNLPIKLSDPQEMKKFEHKAEQIVKNEKLDQLSDDELFKALGGKYSKLNIENALSKLKQGEQKQAAAPEMKQPTTVKQNVNKKEEEVPVLGGPH